MGTAQIFSPKTPDKTCGLGKTAIVDDDAAKLYIFCVILNNRMLILLLGVVVRFGWSRDNITMLPAK